MTTLPSPLALPVSVAAATDTGKVRSNNEDAFLIDEALGLFAVADGVGGHRGGSEASTMTVSELPKLLRTAYNERSGKDLTDPEIQSLLDESIDAINHEVYKAGGNDRNSSRMGTTLTGALFLESGNALIFNVGDSRTYCYRDKTLKQITTDQSWYQSWLDTGQVGSAPPKNVILQGIGLDEAVVPDWVVSGCQANDLWLMCSDGLTDLVNDDAITEMVETFLESSQTLNELCKTLIKAANDAGGDDNITVLALKRQ